MSKRTQKPDEVVEVNTDFGFLAEYQEADTSMDALAEYRIVPRMKVIQAMSDKDLKAEFGEGSVIVYPGGQKIAGAEEGFLFVPVFFFPEFMKWADRNDKESNAILDRSFDPQSEIALRSRDPERRNEEYPDGRKDRKGKPLEFRYCEHLNFVGVVYNEEGDFEPVILGFAKGDFSKGKQLASSIRMRRADGRPVPMWAQVWQFHTVLNEGSEGSWYQLRSSSPTVNVIQAEHAPALKELHEMLKDEHLKGLVRVGGDEEEEGGGEPVEGKY